MKTISYYLFLGAILVLSSSCSRYYYQANAVNTPMLGKKNDANVTVAGDWSSEALTLNFQAAYSPVEYLGIIGGFSNYSYGAPTPDPLSGDVDVYATLLEGGVGGYYPVFTNGRGLEVIVDTYVGYGGGRFDSDVRMNFNRLFIQPGIGLSTPYFDAAFSPRIVGMRYTDFDANGRDEAYIQERHLSDITSGRHYFFEPTLTLRGGYKFVKLQTQLVLSTPMKNVAWHYNESVLNVGLYFSIDDLLTHIRSRKR